MNLLVIFLTGLTTGGITCLAMQGGLLAGVIANQKDLVTHKTQPDWIPVGLFLLTKLVAHVILGALLGWLGSVMTLSLGMRLFFQLFTAVFMFATAMNLLKVHPIFRYVSFQTPKFLQKLVRRTSKSDTLFAPAVLGLMTIFIPCGVTQAMEVLAINSGSPVAGALIMFAFVLGTSPLFAALGFATAKLSESWSQKFAKFAAISLVVMAALGVNGVLVVLDSPVTFNKLVAPVTYFFSDERFSQAAAVATDAQGVQLVTINVRNNGYQPNRLQVKSGIPVKLTLQSQETYSCALGFVLKEFGIRASLAANDSQSFTFTPTKPGKYTFTCEMGMYSGVMEVI